MKRLLAALLLALFVIEVAVDTFDPACVDSAQPCHTCLCQTRAVTPKPAVSALRVAVTPRLVASASETFADRLSDKSILQPPRLPA